MPGTPINGKVHPEEQQLHRDGNSTQEVARGLDTILLLNLFGIVAKLEHEGIPCLQARLELGRDGLRLDQHEKKQEQKEDDGDTIAQYSQGNIDGCFGKCYAAVRYKGVER